MAVVKTVRGQIGGMITLTVRPTTNVYNADLFPVELYGLHLPSILEETRALRRVRNHSSRQYLERVVLSAASVASPSVCRASLHCGRRVARPNRSTDPEGNTLRTTQHSEWFFRTDNSNSSGHQHKPLSFMEPTGNIWKIYQLFYLCKLSCTI